MGRLGAVGRREVGFWGGALQRNRFRGGGVGEILIRSDPAYRPPSLDPRQLRGKAADRHGLWPCHAVVQAHGGG